MVENPPDAVVYPRSEADVVKIVKLCSDKKIAVTPFGGHSSVTRGVEAPKGGVSLDLTRHMDRVLRVSEENSSVTVQPGMFGPALEKHLNSFGTGYTCGHFPQSFEHSTVGGWVVTRGAGQASTGYGKIEDMVLSMRVVTPRGVIVTKDYPAAAIGPDIDQIIIGSEGAFGVVTEVTMKIRAWRPDNTVYASFLYKDFESAVKAMRVSMQGEFGKPHLFRISDPEETDVAFAMKGMNGSAADRVLRLLGYKPLKRCLMFVAVEGDADYAKLVAAKIKSVAKKHGGLSLGAGPTQKWLEQRYSSAYLRDPLMDLGLMTDTLETAVSWENLMQVWSATRAYLKARPNTVCMVHISHVYENGANLYFTFLSPIRKGKDIEDFTRYHRGLIDTIHASGGSLSHHHGVGRMMGALMNWATRPTTSSGHHLDRAALKGRHVSLRGEPMRYQTARRVSRLRPGAGTGRTTQVSEPPHKGHRQRRGRWCGGVRLIEEDMLVGMVSKNDDLWSRKDLNPWLASLYVVPEFRRRGIAEALVGAVIEKARGLGYPELYLFLGHEDGLDLALYYGNRGWQYMEDAVDNDGNPTKIFFYQL